MKNRLFRGAAILFVGAAAVVGPVAAAGVASAAPKTTYTTISGVTLANMWMHCNAFGGSYSEGPGWATCVLPSGQVVVCTTKQCIIDAVTVSTGTGVEVSRSSIVGMRAN